MTVRRTLASLLLLLTGAATGAHALGRDLPYDSFTTADAVTWIQLCGSWGPQRDDGTYRIVHAERYGQSFVYVQWMQRDDQGGLRAVHTQSIAELDNDHAEVSLTDIACCAAPRGIVVTARASSGHNDRLRRVNIEAGPAPGHYQYREQHRR